MIKQKYLELLQSWAKAAEKHIYRFPDRPELAFYGSGTNTWGVQTNQKALAAFAVLATEPDLDEKKVGMTREEILDYALSMLRFSLQSHIEGDYTCTDGTSWGHTWISVLGIERMMHGVEAIEDYLTEEDKLLLKKVLISESDWLMDNYPIEAGPLAEANKPESNIWNGAILHRTAALYPDTPRSKEYMEKGSKFLINGISVPDDAKSLDIVDGKKISDCYVGNNFFESYALNHHRYMNVGYMVICLSNAAMLHFMYRNKELQPPQALYHHVEDLWKLVKSCIFPDGRLLRIGGDTRVRYCYCQDYLIPALLMIEDKYGDMDCSKFEQGWLDIAKQEQEYNGDGSFLSKRAEKLAKVSPLYYTRLESDRAVTISMGLYWRRIIEFNKTNGMEKDVQDMQPLKSWKDDYHGACLHKSDNRIASWVWEAAEKPQGLCLPPNRSDMAEWHVNLAGEIKGMGFFNKNRIEFHKEHLFNGGFLTYGKLKVRSEKFVAEGEGDRDVASEKIVYAALPDGATVLIMQHANALNRDYFSSVKGLFLQIPNDLFNGNNRTYYTEKGKMKIQGYGSQEEQMELCGSWINIDDCLTVMKCYGDYPISIYRPGTRQIQIMNRLPDTGNLYVDEICCPCRCELHSAGKGDSLFDIGFMLRTSEDHIGAEKYNETQKRLTVLVNDDGETRSIMCHGVDGKNYLLIADMDLSAESIEKNVFIKLPGEFSKIIDVVKNESYVYDKGNGGFIYPLKKNSAALFIVE